MFETTYEICSGYVAYMVVIPGRRAMTPNRRMYAAAAYTAAGGSSAAGTAVPVSLSTGSTCCPSVLPTSAQPVAGGSSSTPPAAMGGTCAVNVSYHGKDPIPGFTPGRDDSGVDACAKPGMPIYAPATSVLIQPIQQNWYAAAAVDAVRVRPADLRHLPGGRVLVSWPSRSRRSRRRWARCSRPGSRWRPSRARALHRDRVGLANDHHASARAAVCPPGSGRADPGGGDLQAVLRDPLGGPEPMSGADARFRRQLATVSRDRLRRGDCRMRNPGLRRFVELE